jgi:hypothetical protein
VAGAAAALKDAWFEVYRVRFRSRYDMLYLFTAAGS